MFSKNLGATASYRTLARGSGCRWARTYRGSQQDHVARRTPQPADARVARRPGRASNAPAQS